MPAVCNGHESQIVIACKLLCAHGHEKKRPGCAPEPHQEGPIVSARRVRATAAHY